MGASKRVDWSALEWIAVRACFAVLAQTGMRKAEVALPHGEAFGRRHLSRAAVAWRMAGVFVVSPSAEQLVAPRARVRIDLQAVL